MSVEAAQKESPSASLRLEALGEREFARIVDFIQAESGICLPPTKQSLVHSRVAKRLRALGLSRYEDYCDYIERPGADAERQELVYALTTNVTRFFREPHHFDQLRDEVLPPLIERARRGGRVRIWSAGCSSGEEPYSIAMTLFSLMPRAAEHDIKLLATDIDEHILTTAKRGTYSKEQVMMIPPKLRETAFGRAGKSSASASFTVRDEIKSLITFKRLNLIRPWPVRGPFDVISCRNTMIYFDNPTQETIWQGFSNVLAPGGYMMIGHSERVSGPAAASFTPTGVTAYRHKG